MAWRGVAWRGVIWCSVVWCGVVWCGVWCVVRCGVTVVWCGAVCGVVRCGAVCGVERPLEHYSGSHYCIMASAVPHAEQSIACF
eukprot:10232462-Lingulodinium_polyedra.AAC.1